MASKTETSNVISLKGSVDIITEFFRYSINNILYQRGIYPPESFKSVKQYGLSMMFSTDEQLNNYLTNVIKQVESWLMEGSVQKLVLVVKGLESKETLERWVFECTCTSKDKK
jgi:mitotic spindle assembly checkpoint protein MAD2